MVCGESDRYVGCGGDDGGRHEPGGEGRECADRCELGGSTRECGSDGLEFAGGRELGGSIRDHGGSGRARGCWRGGGGRECGGGRGGGGRERGGGGRVRSVELGGGGSGRGWSTRDHGAVRALCLRALQSWRQLKQRVPSRGNPGETRKRKADADKPPALLEALSSAKETPILSPASSVQGPQFSPKPNFALAAHELPPDLKS